MPRTRAGASILHCDRDALHAASPPFTTVQKRRPQARFIRMKSASQKRTPSIVNLTVKRRYLTEREVDRLMDCARKYGRYRPRDATMILVAYRHGLRASEVCDLQWQQIELSGPIGFHRLIQRLGEAAKMPFPIYPHMLRHACGFKLANDGHDTRALQHYLGHKNIQHTVRYTEMAPDRFKDFWRD
jgi:type 1 fimbriae regulatory protein FimB/type 1 fimbriae regulatory protein FimE